jgi:hypothetical protein
LVTSRAGLALVTLADEAEIKSNNQSRFIIAPSTNEVHSFDTREQVNQAAQVLSKAGFDMRKLSLLGEGHHGALHTLRERSTGEHIRSWTGVGLVWGALIGLLAPVPDGGLATSQGYLVATLIQTLAGAAALSVLAAAVGASTRPGRDGGVPQGAGVSHEHGGFRLVIRGSTDDHALARRLLETNTSSTAQLPAIADTAADRSVDGVGDALGDASGVASGDSANNAVVEDATVPTDGAVHIAPGASVRLFQAPARPVTRHPAGDAAPGEAPARQNTRRERLSA